MAISAPLILRHLQEKLISRSGRHLYGILGKYQTLADFEKKHLPQLKISTDMNVPEPVNVNRALLDRIEDKVLRELVNNEGRMPVTITKKLKDEFDNLLSSELLKNNIVILKHLELLYAYNVEIDCLRRRATNENHIILLLPGKIQNDRIILFFEAHYESQRIFQNNLIATDHLWEL